MKLRQAQDDEARGAIEAQMAADAQLASILAALSATRTSARDRQTAMEAKIRQEARKLRQGEGGGDGEGGGGAASAREGVAAGRHVVDFDSLSFAHGGHTMTNKSCQLPQGSYRCGWGDGDGTSGGLAAGPGGWGLDPGRGLGRWRAGVALGLDSSGQQH